MPYLKKTYFFGAEGNKARIFYFRPELLLRKKIFFFCGSRFSIGVGSGLDALYFCLKCLNLKKDDEVIVPSNTYIATWIAISKSGAKIVPVEPNILSYNIEAEQIEKNNKKNKGYNYCSLIWNAS